MVDWPMSIHDFFRLIGVGSEDTYLPGQPILLGEKGILIWIDKNSNIKKIWFPSNMLRVIDTSYIKIRPVAI